MPKYNILVTGVGAIIGYGIVHSLRASKYDVCITGMDIYEDAVGQEWCDHFVQAIPAASDEYPQFLMDTIHKCAIDLVFFGTEQEIARCCAEKDFFGNAYEKLVINRREIFSITEDKWKTYCFLVRHGLPAIPSSIDPDFETAVKTFGLPLLLKPRRSYASKGIKITSDRDVFYRWANDQGDGFMMQKFIGDKEHEYTASAFGFGDGTGVAPIILRRRLSPEGSTQKAIVTKNAEIENVISQLITLLKPIGPTNFQFRIMDNTPYLLEINPRISSATSIRTAFGYNEAEMCISYFLKGEKILSPQIKNGRATRYIAERIEYNVGDFV